jgi:lysophospholipase L1-like esterase
MRNRKAMVLFASLLLGCFLFYFFFQKANHSLPISVKTESIIIEEQAIESENYSADTAVEIEEQPDLASDTASTTDQSTTSIKQEIKEKVREVVEGAFNLFKKDQKIVSIGDSLTQGVGDETENGGYVGILQHTFEDHQLNIQIENFGKRGNRTDQLLKRLENEKIAAAIEDADMVLITIGANDIMNIVRKNFMNLNIELFQDEKPKYTERLRAIFTKISELNPDAEIYLIGFYNPFEYYFSDIEQLNIIMDNWNLAGQSVTAEFENVHYIPIEDLFSDTETELLAEDYFHPNTTGYKLIAKRILQHMNEFEVVGTEGQVP